MLELEILNNRINKSPLLHTAVLHACFRSWIFNGQANTTSRGNMSTTAAILNQPCPDVTRSFPRQLKCSLLCINIQLMNTRGAFSNFASATVGHELKENCIIFRSIISQTSNVALSWAPSYDTEFCLDIFSVVLPQVFSFFLCKAFHIQVSYCTSLPS